jgi:hypothetical protein
MTPRDALGERILITIIYSGELIGPPGKIFSSLSDEIWMIARRPRFDWTNDAPLQATDLDVTK